MDEIEKVLVSEAEERINDAFKKYPEHFEGISKRGLATFLSLISSEIHLAVNDERVREWIQEQVD